MAEQSSRSYTFLREPQANIESEVTCSKFSNTSRSISIKPIVVATDLLLVVSSSSLDFMMATAKLSKKSASEKQSQILEKALVALDPPVSFSSLSKSYDNLVHALFEEQELLLPTERSEKDTIFQSTIIRQANYLRALQLTSKLLIGIYKNSPANNTSTTNVKAQNWKILEQTIQRCQLLLTVLENTYSHNNIDETASLPPSDYKVLQQLASEKHIFYVHPRNKDGMYDYNDQEISDDDQPILTFDKRVLELEEQELIRMANTPIPGEAEYTEETNEAKKNSSSGNKLGEQEKDADMPIHWKLQLEWTKEAYQECQSRKRRRLNAPATKTTA